MVVFFFTLRLNQVRFSSHNLSKSRNQTGDSISISILNYKRRLTIKNQILHKIQSKSVKINTFSCNHWTFNFDNSFKFWEKISGREFSTKTISNSGAEKKKIKVNQNYKWPHNTNLLKEKRVCRLYWLHFEKELVIFPLAERHNWTKKKWVVSSYFQLKLWGWKDLLWRWPKWMKRSVDVVDVSFFEFEKIWKN